MASEKLCGHGVSLRVACLQCGIFSISGYESQILSHGIVRLNRPDQAGAYSPRSYLSEEACRRLVYMERGEAIALIEAHVRKSALSSYLSSKPAGEPEKTSTARSAGTPDQEALKLIQRAAKEGISMASSTLARWMRKQGHPISGNRVASLLEKAKQ